MHGVAAAAGERFGDRDVGIETVAMLVERRDREVRAEPDRAGVGRQRAGQQIDQRGLAAAVRPDDADAVAALDADREVADDRAAFVALADAVRLDHQRAGLRRRAGGDGGVAGARPVGAALFPQRLQLADPAHVALAPRGDAVAQPMLFGDDLAVELVLVAFLFRQHRVAPFLEMGEAAFQAARLAAIEPDRDARERRQETPVVADDHQRGAPRSEIALQPFDRGQVEMVGRLVEQQDIGRGRQHARERSAARFAAGEMRRMLLAGEAELLQQIAGGMRSSAGPSPAST